MTALDSQDGTYKMIGQDIPSYYTQQFPIQNRCTNCNIEYAGNNNYPKKHYCYKCKVLMSNVFNQVHILHPVNEMDEIITQKKEIARKKELEDENEKYKIIEMKIKEQHEKTRKEEEELEETIKKERAIIKKQIKEIRLNHALEKYHEYKQRQKQEKENIVVPQTEERTITKYEQQKLDLIEFLSSSDEKKSELFKYIVQTEIASRREFSFQSKVIRDKMNPGMTDFSELDELTRRFNIYLHVGRVKELREEQTKLQEQVIANAMGIEYNSKISIEDRRLKIASLQINVAVDKLERDGKIF